MYFDFMALYYARDSFLTNVVFFDFWSGKTDASLPPTDASAIQAVTPSDMFSWSGTDAPITMQSERTGIENKWFALTGRVVELKVDEDGDLHIGLHDATG